METTAPLRTSEQSLVTVLCLGEKIRIDSSPQSFSDFNSWVRARFGVATTDKISFKNLSGTGKYTKIPFICTKKLIISRSPCSLFPYFWTIHSPAEIIPAGNFFCKSDFIEVVVESVTAPEVASTAVISPTATDSSSNFFCNYGAPCLILLIAMALTPSSGVFVDYVLLQGFQSKHDRKTIIECYINFLCWSSTYLFVRRMLNPETGSVAFKKFSADAFYGGLAAASTAFIKPFLTAALNI